MSLNGNHTGAPWPAMDPNAVERRSGHALTPLSSVLLVLAWPVAAWYIIGDLSESTLPPSQSDYMVHPPPVPDWLAHTAGITAIVAVLASIALLFRQQKRKLVTRRTWVPVPLLLAAGFIVAFTERVVTAASIGANIGGGIVLLFAIPTVVALGIGAVIFWFVYFNLERRRQ